MDVVDGLVGSVRVRVGPPDTERPAPTSLSVELVATPDVAVWLSRFCGFRDGIEFSMSVRRRVPPGTDLDPDGGPFLSLASRQQPSREPIAMDDQMLIGVEFADGRTALDAPIVRQIRGRSPWAREQDRHPELTQMTATSSGGSKSDHVMWLTPPPPDGPTTFYFAWRQYGIPETHHTVENAQFSSLASRAQVLWPAPPPQPRTHYTSPPPPRPLTQGWFGEHALAGVDPPHEEGR